MTGRHHVRVALFVTAATVLVACNGGDDNEDDDDAGSAVIVTTTTSIAATAATTAPSTVATSTTGPVTSAATTAPSITPTTPPTAPPIAPTPAPPPVVGNPSVGAAPIAEFEAPVGFAVRPGDTALYVIEQPGRIVRYEPDDGNTRVVADIGEAVSYDGEQGLLGLAFTPDGTFAYLNYTDNAGDTNVNEYAVAPDGTFDVGNARNLLVVDQPYANHNGGDLAIGPDGMLYIALGDGGSGGDPERRASDPTTKLGALLRIDPTPSATAPYSIPPDNPFATGTYNGIAGAPEVWAWGLRNPWRIDFDPVTGDLWIADVGQNRIEEVSLATAALGQPAGRGANFGWSAFEGTERFNTDVADPGDTVMPVLTYEHGDDGCSVSGGAVYRGAAIPELEPAYVYGDYCSGKLWALDLAGGRNLLLLEDKRFAELAAVRRGPDGELWVIERSGGLWLLTAA